MSGAVTWLGHATVVVDLDGERVVTDPVLRRRVVHLRRARAAQPPTGATAVLLSHLHYDHLDVPSMRTFARELPVVLPRGGARLLRGFADVREVEPGDSVQIGDLQVVSMDPESPALFELYADVPGSYPITLVDAERRLGVLEVRG